MLLAASFMKPTPYVSTSSDVVLLTGMTLRGREEDLRQITDLFEHAKKRLITLSGPPGVGKTRLALELLLRRPRGMDGVFVDLADATNIASMTRSIARAVGIATDAGGAKSNSRIPLNAAPPASGNDDEAEAELVLVGAALALRGPMILVLDNIDATTAIARGIVSELLVLSPELSVVVTSRARLSIAIERVHEVKPLETVSRDGERSPAAELFLDRASDAAGGASFDDAAIEDVDAIVAALDGLPLAIELAAARVSLLSPAELRKRLVVGSSLGRDRHDSAASSPMPLSLLEGPSGSLRASIEESWRLLSEDERLTLVAFGGFRGQFGVTLAEAVCRELALTISPLAAVQSLRERSLLQLVEPPKGSARGSSGSARRLRLYESVRAFAREKASAEDRERVRGPIARAIGGLAEQCMEEAWGKASTASLRTLLAEEHNLEELILTVERETPRDPSTRKDAMLAALRAATALIYLREEVGPGDTLPRLVEAILAALDRERVSFEGEAEERALAAFEGRASGVLERNGDFERAKMLSASAIERARRLRASRLEGLILLGRAYGARVHGRRDVLLTTLNEALELAKQTNDDVIASIAEKLRADAHQSALEVDDGLLCIERSIAHARRADDARLLGRALLTGAILLADRGDVTKALSMATSTRASCEEIEERKGAGFACIVAGVSALELERLDEADRHFRDAINYGQQLGLPRLAAYGFAFMGACLYFRGVLDEAEVALAEAVHLLGHTAEPVRAIAARCFRASITALSGRVEEARRTFHKAREESAGTRGEMVVEMLATTLDVAEGTRLFNQGKTEEAEERIAKARITLDGVDRLARSLSPDGAKVPSIILRIGLRVVERALHAYAPPEDALVLVEAKKQARVPGSQVVIDLSDKPMLFRLVSALASSHERGEPTDRERLIAAVWPGEKIAAKAAQNRLFVALHKLKSMGFDEILEAAQAGSVSLSRNVKVVRALRLPPGVDPDAKAPTKTIRDS